jgi:Ser/Thr protein kinase RdoA (MazF antagonist)
MADGTGRIEELTLQGQAAAVALARRHGLPADDPRVLSSRGNLLVHLAPAPVVARVATLTALSRSDPFAWLAREVAVARYVAGRGGPVVPPASAADPGPHREGAFAISLWEHIPALDLKPSPADVGAALAQLHISAQACRAELGEMSPVRELISDGLCALERAAAIDAPALAALRSAHSDVLAELATWRPAELTGGLHQQIVLHGDAHAGNLLADPGRGWLWIDLEETCRGPAAWDLATAAGRDAGDQGLSVLRAYAAGSGSPGPGAADLGPFYRARVLEGAVWSLCMAQLYPARYADVAGRLLAEVLAG